MNQQTPLHLVADSELDGTVDSWRLPHGLPAGVAIFPRHFSGERLWKYDPKNTILIPAPAIRIEDIISDYVEYQVLVHNHRRSMLEKQEDIPEEYRPFVIYFPSDVYLRCVEAAVRFIYCIKYVDDKWTEGEARLDSVPLKGNGRIIMMR